MGVLYIVATPIGNLADMTFRAVDVLKNVDLILCEDTRNTKVLLDHFQIKAELLSYHQHSKIEKADYIAGLLKNGKNIALVSDAGTPGISDPGNQLIKQLTGSFSESLKIIPIPGPSALITALSVSGFATDNFLFLGFAPTKNKRQKFFKEVINSKYPVVFYESPFRIIKTLGELSGLDKNLEILVGRELTKKFETIYRGNIEKVLENVKNSIIKGEFVIIVDRNE
jgi:16S rRNA (cytidine1402-2'-O)-methyltransferase